MSEEVIKISATDVDNIASEYKKQRAAAANITVQLSGVNTLDTLFLLKIMSKKEPEVEDIAQAAETMLDGRTITFLNGAQIIYSVAYNRSTGGALHLLFKDKAYLYDVLQQTVYALMLKKLTPHLESSN